MKRRIPVSAKLVAALAVPLVALVTVSLVEVHRSDQRADEVRRQASFAVATTGPGGVIDALQAERNRALADQVLGTAAPTEQAPDAEEQFEGVQSSLPSEEEARAATDEALVEFEATVESSSAEVRAAYASSLSVLRNIDAVRSQLDLGRLTTAQGIDDAYSGLISPYVDATHGLVGAIDDSGLRSGATVLDGIAHLVEAEGDLSLAVTTLLQSSTATGAAPAPSSAEVAAVATALATAEQWRETITTAAEGGYEEEVATTLGARSRKDLYAVAADTLEGNPIDQDEAISALSGTTSDGDANLSTLRLRVADELRAVADSRLDAAAAEQRIVLLLAVAALLLADGLALVASRSITRPLRRLTAQAHDMAEHRLPDAVGTVLDTPLGEDVVMPALAPIEVKTRDEVAEVVKALNVVQTSALELATEQAVLRRNIADAFVHLGRRNQNLLARQLELITDLERNESDPDALDSLFRLDHLATRMRRNAESLLVLAGLEQPRQWSAPVPLSAVVRAAIGEVEDYTRVELALADEPKVRGSVATDLAHLLAELVENALAFSPETERVEIIGRRSGTGYRLSVVDHGVGMPEADRIRANRRLAGEESFTVAPSRYLGHYVAGRLAQRVGVRAQLVDSTRRGVTVEVLVPDAQLEANGPEPIEAPPLDVFAADRVEEVAPVASIGPASLAQRVRGAHLAEFTLPTVAPAPPPLVAPAIDGPPAAPLPSRVGATVTPIGAASSAASAGADTAHGAPTNGAPPESGRDLGAARDFFAAFRVGAESGRDDGAADLPDGDRPIGEDRS